MSHPDDAMLQRFSYEISDEINARIARRALLEDARHAEVVERLDEMQATLDQYRERLAEAERLLGIEHRELHDVSYDEHASGDQSVLWDDFDFDQSVRMADRSRK